MYRFSIEGDEWILRFSPQVYMDSAEKQTILFALLHIGVELDNYSHRSAFIIFAKEIGAIVFDVERIPSLILTVSNIISKDHWYNQDFPSLKTLEY
ncbi:hypothetical protein [Neobacillus drentensis]|uniref:hypothetical protein n=1 Tax=Neobacillus drentensis TaxID=220684 RepID=UPI002863874D|nr:hypothetical protein [Neobacillus drentensis]MDR7238589.1 hypothetical protein [Neobacillus drentensis]